MGNQGQLTARPDYAANPDKTEYDALAQTLHYAENDAKTKLNESAQLVTGIYCRADHAWEDMRAVQERFGHPPKEVFDVLDKLDEIAENCSAREGAAINAQTDRMRDLLIGSH